MLYYRQKKQENKHRIMSYRAERARRFVEAVGQLDAAVPDRCRKCEKVSERCAGLASYVAALGVSIEDATACVVEETAGCEGLQAAATQGSVPDCANNLRFYN